MDKPVSILTPTEITHPKVDRQELANRCEELINQPKITELKKKIEAHKKDLGNALESIEKKTPPIVENSYLWGAINSYQPKDSLQKFYTEYVGSSKQIMTAIKDTYQYMGDMLGLMALLAATERDLYHLIDDNEISAAEFSKLVKDLCKESNIKDERVEELFTQTFERAYTLRDRINLLRRELNDRIDEILSKFEDFDDTVKSEKKELLRLGSEQQTMLNSTVTGLINQVNTDLSDTLSKCNSVLEECKKSVDRISTFEKEITTKINEEASNERKRLNELSSNQQEQLQSSVSKLISEATSDIAGTLSKCSDTLNQCKANAENISKSFDSMETSLKENMDKKFSISYKDLQSSIDNEGHKLDNKIQSLERKIDKKQTINNLIMIIVGLLSLGAIGISVLL